MLVGKQDADVRAAADAGGDQAARDRARRALGVGVGEPLVVAHDHGWSPRSRACGREDRADGRRRTRSSRLATRRHGREALDPTRDRRHLGGAEQLVAVVQLGLGVDAVVVDRAACGDAQRRSEWRRAAVAEREAGGLAGDAEVAVELLEHAVEEDREEPAVHDAGRALVAERELDLAVGAVVGAASACTAGSTG